MRMELGFDVQHTIDDGRFPSAFCQRGSVGKTRFLAEQQQRRVVYTASCGTAVVLNRLPKMRNSSAEAVLGGM